MNKSILTLAIGGFLASASFVAQADSVILDDQIVDGSICVGMDCVNGESFGFDTIRLKENNLRIKFDDTSNSGSFPNNDWQITANDSGNGGANKFSIDDISGGKTPFTIEASAPSNSLYVDDGGRVGLGTSSPVVEVHVVDGDSPTIRLEQDGSSGFTAQTWDIAGNEANFFVRDVTNGSRLPFKIVPSAPTNSLYIAADGDVGIGTASPSANLDVIDSSSGNILTADGVTGLRVQNTQAEGARLLMSVENNGIVAMALQDESADGDTWLLVNDQGSFTINKETSSAFSGNQLFKIRDNGDIIVTKANGDKISLRDLISAVESAHGALPTQ